MTAQLSMTFEEAKYRAEARHVIVKKCRQPGNDYRLEYICTCGRFVHAEDWRRHILSEIDAMGVSVTSEQRTFRIRACPECGVVNMPHYRDDHPYCERGHGARRVRLAWFDVEESDTTLNRLNAEARAAAESGKGYDEYQPSPRGAFVHNWVTGASRIEEFS